MLVFQQSQTLLPKYYFTKVYMSHKLIVEFAFRNINKSVSSTVLQIRITGFWTWPQDFIVNNIIYQLNIRNLNLVTIA